MIALNVRLCWAVGEIAYDVYSLDKQCSTCAAEYHSKNVDRFRNICGCKPAEIGWENGF
jgi:hypothetical protein